MSGVSGFLPDAPTCTPTGRDDVFPAGSIECQRPSMHLFRMGYNLMTVVAMFAVIVGHFGCGLSIAGLAGLLEMNRKESCDIATPWATGSVRLICLAESLGVFSVEDPSVPTHTSSNSDRWLLARNPSKVAMFSVSHCPLQRRAVRAARSNSTHFS